MLNGVKQQATYYRTGGNTGYELVVTTAEWRRRRPWAEEPSMLERALVGHREYQADNYEAPSETACIYVVQSPTTSASSPPQRLNVTRVIAVSVKDAILTAIGSEAR